MGRARAAHGARGRRDPARRRRRCADARRDARRARAGARVRERRPLHGRRRGRHARERAAPGRREPARHARAAQARPRPRGALGPRLRHARGREGRRRAGARPPAHAPAGALGPAHPRRRGRPRGARDRSDTRSRGHGPAACVTRIASPKLGAYVALAAAGLLAAIALRRAELVVLAAPFAILLGVGLAAARAPRLQISLQLDRERVTEGDEIVAALELRSAVPVERLDVLLPLPEGLEACGGTNPNGVRLAAAEPHVLELPIRCARWGGYAVGEPLLRARDAVGLFSYEATATASAPLRVYPLPPTLRALLDPLETQVFAGNQVARVRGDGIEFADLRPFVPGDRLRRVNWRASARRGELWINDRHPER